jgi:hypothetical protein
MAHRTNFKLSIRRVDSFTLPGQDSINDNPKIGGALHGKSVLKGLSFDEEQKYLPSIINISPKDPAWHKETKDYWCNISVPIPHDSMGIGELPGHPLDFTIDFKEESDKLAFEKTVNLKEKGEISKRGDVIEGIGDYILFRYCLVYSKVAVAYSLVRKSAKILFYLYSPSTEKSLSKIKFEKRIKARELFNGILEKESIIDAMLLLYKQDLSLFKELGDKHMALEAKIEKNPDIFLTEINNTNLKYKAFIMKAVNLRIIHNPKNTDTYYWGENNEVTLGNTMQDAILYIKNEANKQIVDSIKGALKTT